MKKATLTENDGRIEIRFAYDRQLHAIVGALPERQFEKVKRDDGSEDAFWSLPLRRIKDVIKALDPEFHCYDFEWFMLARKYDTLRHMARRLTDEDPVPYVTNERMKEAVNLGTITEALFPFQRATVEFAYIAGTRLIVADDMGLGKTIQGIALSAYWAKLRPVTIFCPAVAKFVWQEELNKWLPSARVFVCEGKSPETPPDANFFIVNYDILNDWQDTLRAVRSRIVIADEAHRLKNLSAQRTQAARELVDMATGVLLLTGTPVEKRPRELWSLLNMIDPRQWADFHSYGVRYCAGKQIEVKIRGGKRKKVWRYEGASNLQDLHEQAAPYMVRRLKPDVLPQLPPKQRIVVPLRFDGKRAKAYRDVFEKTRKDVEEYVKANGDFGPSLVVQLTELRKALSELKVDLVGDWIEEVIQSQKVIVFCAFIEAAKKLTDRFYMDGVVSITGATSPKERAEAVRAFQNDDGVRLFVGNIVAASEAITLTAGSVVTFVDNTFNPKRHEQAEDRANRIGQANQVTAVYFAVRGTVDEKLLDILEEGRQNADMIVDGDVDGEGAFNAKDQDGARQLALSMIGDK